MTGFIYFIRCGDFVKVGYSVNPKRRHQQLAASTPHNLVLVATYPGTQFIETKLHRYLAAYRYRKDRREWFVWCEAIETITKTGIPPPEILSPPKGRKPRKPHPRALNWQAHLTPPERRRIAVLERKIARMDVPLKAARERRLLIQNRASVRVGRDTHK